jgi:hypothetical protein
MIGTLIFAGLVGLAVYLHMKQNPFMMKLEEGIKSLWNKIFKKNQ